MVHSSTWHSTGGGAGGSTSAGCLPDEAATTSAAGAPLSSPASAPEDRLLTEGEITVHSLWRVLNIYRRFRFSSKHKPPQQQQAATQVGQRSEIANQQQRKHLQQDARGVPQQPAVPEAIGEKKEETAACQLIEEIAAQCTSSTGEEASFCPSRSFLEWNRERFSPPLKWEMLDAAELLPLIPPSPEAEQRRAVYIQLHELLLGLPPPILVSKRPPPYALPLDALFYNPQHSQSHLSFPRGGGKPPLTLRQLFLHVPISRREQTWLDALHLHLARLFRPPRFCPQLPGPDAADAAGAAGAAGAAAADLLTSGRVGATLKKSSSSSSGGPVSGAGVSFAAAEAERGEERSSIAQQQELETKPGCPTAGNTENKAISKGKGGKAVTAAGALTKNNQPSSKASAVGEKEAKKESQREEGDATAASQRASVATPAAAEGAEVHRTMEKSTRAEPDVAERHSLHSQKSSGPFSAGGPAAVEGYSLAGGEDEGCTTGIDAAAKGEGAATKSEAPETAAVAGGGVIRDGDGGAEPKGKEAEERKEADATAALDSTAGGGTAARIQQEAAAATQPAAREDPKNGKKHAKERRSTGSRYSSSSSRSNSIDISSSSSGDDSSAGLCSAGGGGVCTPYAVPDSHTAASGGASISSGLYSGSNFSRKSSTDSPLADRGLPVHLRGDEDDETLESLLQARAAEDAYFAAVASGGAAAPAEAVGRGEGENCKRLDTYALRGTGLLLYSRSRLRSSSGKEGGEGGGQHHALQVYPQLVEPALLRVLWLMYRSSPRKHLPPAAPSPKGELILQQKLRNSMRLVHPRISLQKGRSSSLFSRNKSGRTSRGRRRSSSSSSRAAAFSKSSKESDYSATATPVSLLQGGIFIPAAGAGAAAGAGVAAPEDAAGPAAARDKGGVAKKESGSIPRAAERREGGGIGGERTTAFPFRSGSSAAWNKAELNAGSSFARLRKRMSFSRGEELLDEDGRYLDTGMTPEDEAMEAEGLAVEAAAHVMKMLEFRREMFPLSDTDAALEEDLTKGVLYWTGRDVALRPVLVLNLRRLDAALTDLPRFLRLLLFVFEWGLRFMMIPGKVETCVVVFDVREVSLWSLPYKCLQVLVQTLTLQYPFRLRKMFVLHNSRLVNGLWNIAKVFLTDVQQAKVATFKVERNCSNPELLAQLHALVPASQLEQKYGGSRANIEEFYPFPVAPPEPLPKEQAGKVLQRVSKLRRD